MNQINPCESFVEEISGSQPASKELIEHLAVCPACRAMAETTAQLCSEKSAYSQTETAALTSRVLSRLAKASSEFPKSPAVPEALTSQAAATGINKLVLVVGAAVLIIVGGLWWSASSSDQPATSGDAKPAAITKQHERPLPGSSVASRPVPLVTGIEGGEVSSRTVPDLDGE